MSGQTGSSYMNFTRGASGSCQARQARGDASSSFRGGHPSELCATTPFLVPGTAPSLLLGISPTTRIAPAAQPSPATLPSNPARTSPLPRSSVLNTKDLRKATARRKPSNSADDSLLHVLATRRLASGLDPQKSCVPWEWP